MKITFDEMATRLNVTPAEVAETVMELNGAAVDIGRQPPIMLYTTSGTRYADVDDQFLAVLREVRDTGRLDG